MSSKFIFFSITTNINLLIGAIKIEEINENLFRTILNETFTTMNNKNLIFSNENNSSIFNKGEKLFEISTKNLTINTDISLDATGNFNIEIFNNKKKIITIHANQCYYYKKRNLIILIGNIEIETIEQKNNIYTEYLIYDIESDSFFNTHKTEIKNKNADILGKKIYFKRDLSYFRLFLDEINLNI